MPSSDTQFRPGHPGRTITQAKGQRSLALACREAASDEQVAEWLLAIAAGRDPWASSTRPGGAPVFTAPPDWTHRMAALKMFLERRDGAPMQAIVLQAQVEASLRGELAGRDVIDVEALEDDGKLALRRALRAALAAADATLPDEPAAVDEPAIEVGGGAP